MEFEQDRETYFFDENGDITLGYEVTVWNSRKGKVQVGDIVAEYHPLNDSFTHTILPRAAYLTDLKVMPLPPTHKHTHAHTVCAISIQTQSHTIHLFFPSELHLHFTNL